MFASNLQIPRLRFLWLHTDLVKRDKRRVDRIAGIAGWGVAWKTRFWNASSAGGGQGLLLPECAPTRKKILAHAHLLLTPAYAVHSVQLMLAHLRAYWPVNIRAYWLQYEITFQADSDALLLSFFDYVLQTAVSALCNLQHSVCVWWLVRSFMSSAILGFDFCYCDEKFRLIYGILSRTIWHTSRRKSTSSFIAFPLHKMKDSLAALIWLNPCSSPIQRTLHQRILATWVTAVSPQTNAGSCVQIPQNTSQPIHSNLPHQSSSCCCRLQHHLKTL